MPRGWYLAQGLIPLGESSSDDEEGPCELPNGRLVCGPHGLVRCGRCCSDYSFMDDILDEDDEISNDSGSDMPGLIPEAPPEDLFGIPKRRGIGRVFPTKFQGALTPSTRPMDLFVGRHTYGLLSRYVRRGNPKQILIFTDGACLNNGLPNPSAGWAFVHGPGLEGLPQPLVTSGRLERTGPFGDDASQTSNRAELRAVIAALRFCHWVGEGWTSIVFATDSEYVTEGCTMWARSWIRRGWKTSAGAAVKNKDLWEMLLGEVERWHGEGLAVQFWRIPRDWNEEADDAAKTAATGDELDQYGDVMGICM